MHICNVDRYTENLYLHLRHSEAIDIAPLLHSFKCHIAFPSWHSFCLPIFPYAAECVPASVYIFHVLYCASYNKKTICQYPWCDLVQLPIQPQQQRANVDVCVFGVCMLHAKTYCIPQKVRKTEKKSTP